MPLLSLTCDGPSEIFRLDDRLVVSLGCLAGIVDELADLGNQLEIRSIVYGSDFVEASSVYASGVMRAVDWGKVSSIATSQWFP